MAQRFWPAGGFRVNIRAFIPTPLNYHGGFCPKMMCGSTL
jgi:hypothetical protein